MYFNQNSIIKVKNLTYSYQENINVFEKISFTIEDNKKTILLGPNGAGKSTLMYNLLGLYTPDSGDIYFKGKKIRDTEESILRKKMAYIFQNPDDQIFAPTVEEDILFGAGQYNIDNNIIKNEMKKLSKLLNIGHLLDRNPRQLSYGEKRRVALAGILIMDPEIIFLDEPLAFLDPRGKKQFINILEKLYDNGKTLFIATHDLNFAVEWGEYFMLLDNGKLDTISQRDIFKGKNPTFSGITPITTSIFKDFIPEKRLPLTIKEGRDLLKRVTLPLNKIE